MGDLRNADDNDDDDDDDRRRPRRKSFLLLYKRKCAHIGKRRGGLREMEVKEQNKRHVGR